MRQTLHSLQAHADVHLLGFLDNATQIDNQKPLEQKCASVHFLVRKHHLRRNPADPYPRVVREFEDPDFDWLVHRITYAARIDVVQLEYTFMAQYMKRYRHVPQFLFEHDIAFQSMGRRIRAGGWTPGTLLAYMQLVRYELAAVRRASGVQVCSAANAEFLLPYAPELKRRIDACTRAVINPLDYPFRTTGREQRTILFAGSFSHAPNVQGLLWFLKNSWPQVLSRIEGVCLVVAGSGLTADLKIALTRPSVNLLGYVPDMGALFAQHTLLICPVLSGSGVRVKLLEAFASGIPVVSTTLGAEGLIGRDQPRCLLADTGDQFADAVVTLLENPQQASALAVAARHYVEQDRNAVSRTAELAASYREDVTALRATSHRSKPRDMT